MNETESLRKYADLRVQMTGQQVERYRGNNDALYQFYRGERVAWDEVTRILKNPSNVNRVMAAITGHD